MSQLREFAQHKADFDRINTKIIALSVDDAAHSHATWDKAVNRQFPVLSDPGAKVIREYGLLHADGLEAEGGQGGRDRRIVRADDAYHAP